MLRLVSSNAAFMASIFSSSSSICGSVPALARINSLDNKASRSLGSRV